MYCICYMSSNFFCHGPTEPSVFFHGVPVPSSPQRIHQYTWYTQLVEILANLWAVIKTSVHFASFPVCQLTHAPNRLSLCLILCLTYLTQLVPLQSLDPPPLSLQLPLDAGHHLSDIPRLPLLLDSFFTTCLPSCLRWLRISRSIRSKSISLHSLLDAHLAVLTPPRCGYHSTCQKRHKLNLSPHLHSRLL